jgi:hypothetical protein
MKNNYGARGRFYVLFQRLQAEHTRALILNSGNGLLSRDSLLPLFEIFLMLHPIKSKI